MLTAISPRRRFAHVAAASVLATLGLATLSSANPTGGQVVAGSATIGTAGSNGVTVTQQSQKAVINWQSFSIGSGETTTFNLPNSSSISLDRVVGSDPSKIMGHLDSNGQIWLINPNGILFSKTARVDVAGLLATTIDITDQNFLSGNYQFDGLQHAGAMVENQGQITIKDRGLAALVAPGVANSGIIQANLGQIQLSAAAAFSVDLYGDGLFNFQLTQQMTQAIAGSDGSKANAAVTNSGRLIADGGKILLTANAARSVVDNAINMSGYVEATTVSTSNGEIVLDGGAEGNVQVSGTLNASGARRGQQGGKIEVLGDSVHLLGTARVNVTGDSGGGKAIIGGDFQGGSPNPAVQSLVGFTSEATAVRNSTSTTIDAGAVIDASATRVGRGGQVAIWSDNATHVFGTLLANGGMLSDGGIIETSSLGLLDVSRAMVLVWGGAGGKQGYWLLDPHFVVTAAGDVNTGLLTGPGDLIAIYGVGNFLPDSDDGGVDDPGEESEYRFPWSVVPRDGLFYQVASVGPNPLFPGVNLHFGASSGALVLGMNGEDGGPAGQYDVSVVIVSNGTIQKVEVGGIIALQLLEGIIAFALQPEGPGELGDAVLLKQISTELEMFEAEGGALEDILFPGGEEIGEVASGAGQGIRTVTSSEFENIESQLMQGAKEIEPGSGYPGKWYERPDGTQFGIRQSESGPTIDIVKSNNPTKIPNGYKIHQGGG